MGGGGTRLDPPGTCLAASGHKGGTARPPAGSHSVRPGSIPPDLGGLEWMLALVMRVELPEEVLLVDLPHLVPRDLLHQQEL